METLRTLAKRHEVEVDPAWDAEAMTRATAATFLDWWWPAAFGAPPAEAVRSALAAALAEMLAPLAGARGFVHRDYFPANLMRLEARVGPRRTVTPVSGTAAKTCVLLGSARIAAARSRPTLPAATSKAATTAMSRTW